MMNLKKRLDIYWNGTDGAKELTLSMLISWKHFPNGAGAVGAAAIELTVALVRAFCILLTPFFFWIAPVVSIFTAHREASEDDVRRVLRDGVHKNGKST